MALMSALPGTQGGCGDGGCDRAGGCGGVMVH